MSRSSVVRSQQNFMGAATAVQVADRAARPLLQQLDDPPDRRHSPGAQIQGPGLVGGPEVVVKGRYWPVATKVMAGTSTSSPSLQPWLSLRAAKAICRALVPLLHIRPKRHPWSAAIWAWKRAIMGPAALLSKTSKDQIPGPLTHPKPPTPICRPAKCLRQPQHFAPADRVKFR